MLKRIIAAALVLVASFQVGAQWQYKESKDAMTDALIAHAVALTDSEVDLFALKRPDGTIRLLFGRGTKGLWSPAIDGNMEIRIDSNPVYSQEFGPRSKMPPIIQANRFTGGVSMLLGNVGTNQASVPLRQMASGKILRVRVDSFTGDRIYREVSLDGAKEALMKLTGKPAEWFEQESNKP